MSLTLCAAASARCQLTGSSRPLSAQPARGHQATAALASRMKSLVLQVGRGPLRCPTGRRWHQQAFGSTPRGSGLRVRATPSPREECCGVCGSGEGGGGWEHNTQRHTSLSLFPSQDLKFNYISKEINFKVPFYARVKYVHCQVCAACDSTCGSFPEPVPPRQLPALCPGAPPTGHLSSLLTRRRRSVAHSTLYHTFPSNKNLGMFTAQVSASGMHTATLRIEKCPLPCPLHRRRFSGPPAAPSSSSRDRSKASTPQ